MKSLVVSAPDARARRVEFIPDALVVHLEDGRSLTVPLEWFPRLRDATPAARNRWELIGRGLGIHWPGLDEDLSVAGLRLSVGVTVGRGTTTRGCSALSAKIRLDSRDLT